MAPHRRVFAITSLDPIAARIPRSSVLRACWNYTRKLAGIHFGEYVQKDMIRVRVSRVRVSKDHRAAIVEMSFISTSVPLALVGSTLVGKDRTILGRQAGIIGGQPPIIGISNRRSQRAYYCSEMTTFGCVDTPPTVATSATSPVPRPAGTVRLI
jgi:hypothetical protein